MRKAQCARAAEHQYVLQDTPDDTGQMVPEVSPRLQQYREIMGLQGLIQVGLVVPELMRGAGAMLQVVAVWASLVLNCTMQDGVSDGVESLQLGPQHLLHAAALAFDAPWPSPDSL